MLIACTLSLCLQHQPDLQRQHETTPIQSSSAGALSSRPTPGKLANLSRFEAESDRDRSSHSPPKRSLDDEQSTAKFQNKLKMFECKQDIGSSVSRSQPGLASPRPRRLGDVNPPLSECVTSPSDTPQRSSNYNQTATSPGFSASSRREASAWGEQPPHSGNKSATDSFQKPHTPDVSQQYLRAVVHVFDTYVYMYFDTLRVLCRFDDAISKST